MELRLISTPWVVVGRQVGVCSIQTYLDNALVRAVGLTPCDPTDTRRLSPSALLSLLAGSENGPSATATGLRRGRACASMGASETPRRAFSHLYSCRENNP
jgi:hypothetical protein